MPNPGTRRQWVLAVLDRYEAPLVRYAARLLGDGDSAREAVQHAFLQLCERSAEELRGREAPWLFRVCRNKAMDLIRLRQRQTGDSEADLATLVGREPDPAELAEQQDLCGELARLVAQLPAGPARGHRSVVRRVFLSRDFRDRRPERGQRPRPGASRDQAVEAGSEGHGVKTPSSLPGW